MIGVMSMAEFAKKIQAESGVKPSYNTFGLFLPTGVCGERTIGNLYLYGMINNKRSIKQVKKRSRISLLAMVTNFIVVYNLDTNKPEIYQDCVDADNVIKNLEDPDSYRVEFSEEALLLKSQTRLYVIGEHGSLKLLEKSKDCTRYIICQSIRYPGWHEI